jgi:hypothetical protein
MDPVNSLSDIVRLLRQRLASRATGTAEAPAARPGTAAAQGRVRPRPSADEIKLRIGERLSALPSPERCGSRGARIFVETVITWEFGSQILRDPEFSDVASDVVATLRNDPPTWNRFQSLLGELGDTRPR